MKRLILDFETRSACDLKRHGAYNYSLHPTTRATCLAYKEDSGLVHLLPFDMIDRPWKNHPFEFRKIWRRFIEFGYLFSAHNALFEKCLYENVLVRRLGWPLIPAAQYRCTAAKAAACALPRSLEGAGAALGLSIQKDKAGFFAMMATCKPTKAYRAWEEKGRQGAAPPMFLEPHHNPETWATLYHYCKVDVLAEEALDRALPDLIPSEQEIWHLNQRMNWKGVRVDIPTIKKVVGIMATEGKRKLKELDSLTMGLVTKPGSRKAILEFLALEGVELPDIKAATVADVLKEGKLSPDMRRLLEIRKALSKTSTKKYQTLIDRAGDDARIRDISIFHAASTGREGGTGAQFHNFPKPIIFIDKERPYAAIENVAECDHETLSIFYGDTLPLVFSSILRNVITADSGHELFVADLSKIEVVQLWWLADNWPGLKVIAAGKDPYKYQAAANTGKRYEDIPDDGPERQLGKAQILGSGFGMGHAKFQATAYTQYRLSLTEEQSKEAIRKYREANAPVVTLWKVYEAAAIKAVEYKGEQVRAGKCIFLRDGKFLWVKLPSGRKLAYLSPEVGWRDTEWGPRKSLSYLGLALNKKDLVREHTYGGKWSQQCTQASARDILIPAALRLEKKGYQPLLMVHDEIVCQRKKGEGNMKEYIDTLCERPAWADKHLVIEAKGYVAERYRK